MNKQELGRQLIHFLYGAVLVLLIYFNILLPLHLIILTIIGLFLSLLSLKIKLPILSFFLENYEREEKIIMPGLGMVFFTFSAFLVLTLFTKDIALASIAILAVGDSFCAIFGAFGKKKCFFNKYKNLEGIIAALLFSTLAAILFVSFVEAFIASFIALIFESIERPRFLDDNLFIPLISGFVIFLLRLIL